MTKVHLIKRISFIICLVCAGLLVFSGCYILMLRLTDNKNNFENKILVNNDEFQSEMVLANEAIFPGESKTFDLVLESKLVENVHYTLSFEDHIVNELDKYFYITLTNNKKESLINNTLDEVFNDKIVIESMLSSYEVQKLSFTFSVSPRLTTSANFDFSILFKAFGRLTN